MNKKASLSLRLLLAVTVICTATSAQAQSLGLSVAVSANSVQVNSNFTYAISVTNETHFDFSDTNTPAFVTNALSGLIQFLSATTNSPVTVLTNNASSVVFDLGLFTTGAVARMTVTVRAKAAGYITNTISIGAPASIDFTNVVTTNIVTLATNPPVVMTNTADLAVFIDGPSSAVITNDYMTYEVIVANLGTNAASNVSLTNTFPPGVRFINPSSNVVWSLGTLTNGDAVTMAFTVQPSNAGTNTFTASVGSADVADPNPANNTASTNIIVGTFLPGQLMAFTVSAMRFNPQTGLMEQRVALANTGATAVASARVTVPGITNWMFNAAGTNNGNPFVVYADTLNTNQGVYLLMECFSPTGEMIPIADSQLQANEVPLPNLAPPANLGTPVTISNLVQLASGDVLIEFPSTLGRSYTVVYYDNEESTNAKVAPPSVVAPANWVQWIDYGAPKTVIPTNLTKRTYFVFEDP